jgi:hypothetical protein
MGINNKRKLWEKLYGKRERIYDIAGRLMLKAAIGDPNSAYEPTVDYIRPPSKGGKNVAENLMICHWKTNEEKADMFPHWKANGKSFRALRMNGCRNGYEIEEI